MGETYDWGGYHTVWYEAAAGERNQLTVDRSETEATFRDRGALITWPLLRPPYACTPLAVQASCKLSPKSDVAVHLGDQDDRMSTAASGVAVFPGAGADLIEGTGAFRIYELEEDRRADRFLAPNATVWYYAGRTPVSVTLDGQANDGTPNEYDDVRAVNVVANIDGSVIVGDDRDNALSARGSCGRFAAPMRLEGGAGNDRLDACGPHLLYGGPGDDDLASDGGGTTLVGGPGRDTYRGRYDHASPFTVDARDGEQDTVQCSAGMTVLADTLDVINGSCASVTVTP